MLTIHKTEDFNRNFDRLPLEIKKIFKKQETIFKNNWLDPRLHCKRLKELQGVFSFCITRRYRALFIFKDSYAVFFAIGHRKDIYD